MDILTLISPYLTDIENAKVELCSKSIKHSSYYKLYWFNMYSSIATNGKRKHHKQNSCYCWYRFRYNPIFNHLSLNQFFEILNNKQHKDYNEACYIQKILNCDDKTHYHYHFDYDEKLDYKQLYIEHLYINKYKLLKSKSLPDSIHSLNTYLEVLENQKNFVTIQIEQLFSQLCQIENDKRKQKKMIEQKEEEVNLLQMVENYLVQTYKDNHRCLHVGTKGKNKDYYCGKNTKNNFCFRHKK